MVAPRSVRAWGRWRRVGGSASDVTLRAVVEDLDVVQGGGADARRDDPVHGCDPDRSPPLGKCEMSITVCATIIWVAAAIT
jgi:hypothetical protein